MQILLILFLILTLMLTGTLIQLNCLPEEASLDIQAMPPLRRLIAYLVISIVFPAAVVAGIFKSFFKENNEGE